MALTTQAAGRLVRITGMLTITTPTNTDFSVTTWCQLNLAEIARQLSIPPAWNYTFHSVETLNSSVTGGITSYQVRIHLSLT